ncbi:hypothetical protein HK098_002576 [Nowakowskiella sp. JEL0407]|nr:hypothetical protein HK098_002576 [Nowakowskiella sp. JEL0407]
MDQVTYGIIPVAVAVFLASWTYSWLTVPNDTKNLKKAKDAGKVAPFNDIPGPVPVPIVGSVGKMISHAMNKRIDNFFNEVNETYGSVARVSIAGKNFLVLSDAAALKQILNNYGEVNRDARLVKAFEGILTYSIGIMPHGDLWMRHRKGLQPAFGPSHMKDAFGITLEVVDELADIWANRISLGKKTRDVYEDATLMTSDVM